MNTVNVHICVSVYILIINIDHYTSDTDSSIAPSSPIGGLRGASRRRIASSDDLEHYDSSSSPISKVQRGTSSIPSFAQEPSAQSVSAIRSSEGVHPPPSTIATSLRRSTVSHSIASKTHAPFVIDADNWKTYCDR